MIYLGVACIKTFYLTLTFEIEHNRTSVLLFDHIIKWPSVDEESVRHYEIRALLRAPQKVTAQVTLKI